LRKKTYNIREPVPGFLSKHGLPEQSTQNVLKCAFPGHVGEDQNVSPADNPDDAVFAVSHRMPLILLSDRIRNPSCRSAVRLTVMTFRVIMSFPDVRSMILSRGYRRARP
jgi:uncharacterized protein